MVLAFKTVMNPVEDRNLACPALGMPGRRCLPTELRQRHEAFYKMAVEHAREKGWNPELGDDE